MPHLCIVFLNGSCSQCVVLLCYENFECFFLNYFASRISAHNHPHTSAHIIDTVSTLTQSQPEPDLNPYPVTITIPQV